MLPGLAYIDMLFQLVKDGLKLEYREYSLKKLMIFNPLIVGKEKGIRIKITFEKKQKYWAIKVEDGEEDKKGELYITVELHKEAPRLEEKIDIEAMKQDVLQKTDIEALYAEARKSGLIHREIIKAEGIIYETETESMSEIRVNHAYRKGGEEFLFHPALIDGAGMASMAIVSRSNPEQIKGKLFLPLSYESFYGREPLQDSCYVRIKRASIRHINDIFTVDMEFFNAEGKQAALLKGLTAKRVRHPGQKLPERSDLREGKELKETEQGERNNTESLGRAAIEETLKKIFSKYIHREFDQAAMERGFFELGLESSQLLGLVKDIEDGFQMSLSPSLLFEYSNLKELGGYLEGRAEKEGDWGYSEKGKIPERVEAVLTAGSYEFYENEPYLRDHRVYGRPALMGITHPCLVLESYLRNNPESYPVEMRNIQFVGGPVGLNKNEAVQIRVKFNGVEKQTGFETTYDVKGYNGSGEEKTGCTGEYIGPVSADPEEIDIEAIIKESKPLEREIIEKSYHTIKGFTIGAMLQTIESAYEYDKSTLIGRVDITGKRKKGNVTEMAFDPLLLNSCYALTNPETVNQGMLEKMNEKIYIPLIIEKIVLYRVMTEKAYLIKKIRSGKEDFLSFDVVVLTESGEMIAEIINASIKSVRTAGQLSNLAETQTAEKEEGDKIAIIGLSGRYAGSRNLEEPGKLKEREGLHNGDTGRKVGLEGIL